MKTITHRFASLTLAGLLGAVTSASVLAASPAPDFSKYDANGDGRISLEEYQAKGGEEQTFRSIDVNGDKLVSHDEFAKQGTPSAARATPATPATPAMPDPSGRL